MKAQADAVIAFIKEQNLANPMVVGHSMGGGIALRVAEQVGKGGNPSISKLVVIDPVAYPPTKPLLGLDLGKLSEMAALPILPEFSRGLVKQILLDAYFVDSKVTDAQFDGYAKGLSTLGQFQALLAHASKLGDLAVPEGDLAKITVTMCIIWGDHDKFLEPSDGDKLKLALPKAELNSIKNCGHIPHEEVPEDTNPIIKAFLDK